MKFALTKIVSCILVALLLGSCGKTYIRVDSTEPYDIYLDSVKVGTSTAIVPSAGIPHTAKLEARDSLGIVVGSGEMSRDFMDLRTLLLGIVTTGIGFVVWYYPNQYEILLYNPQNAPSNVPFAPACSTDAHKINLAVLPLTGSHQFQPEELNAITTRLETELMRYTSYNYMERRDMDQILTEQGFQQSGTCESNECGLQMGQMLGVDYIVTGSLTRLGELITLNLRILNVATGQNEYSMAIDAQNDIATFLQQNCKAAAVQVSREYCPQKYRTAVIQ